MSSPARPVVRVLVVDGEESIRETLGELLLREGYDVEAVADLPSALERIAARPFDVVLTGMSTSSENCVDLMNFVTDRRVAREEQRRLASIIEHSSDFIGLASIDGRVTYLNETGLRLVGLASVEEARQHAIFDFVSDDMRRERSESILADLRARGSASGEGTLRHFGTGGDLDVHFNLFLLPSPEGQAPSDMAVVISSIGQRKAAERALRESEARYRLLTERQRDVVVSVAVDGTLLYCSPAVKAFGGYEPDEEVGQNIAKYVHPDDWPGTAARMATLILERRDMTTEFRYVTSDGSVFPVEVSGTPVVEGDEVQSIQCILRDIRERKQAEQEQLEHLRRVERQHEALATLAADPAFTRGDFAATAADVAERAARALAVDRASVWLETPDGERARQVALFDSREGRVVPGRTLRREVFARIGELLQAGRSIAVDDARTDERLRPEATEYCDDVGLTAILFAPIHAGGEIPGLVALEVTGQPRTWRPDERSFAEALGDHLAQALLVAQRAVAEEEKERLREQLLQAQRLEAVGRLAGGLAHDFNNILTSISGYADLLWEELDARDPLRADVDEIRDATDRAAWLTNQLLAFSRRQVITPRVLHVGEVVDRAHRMLARLIGDDIRLEFRPGRDVWPIKADPGQIDQILVNLATNARDAMPSGGVLTIETANAVVGPEDERISADAQPGDYVRIRARDDGAGMDERTLQYAFEPFFSTKEVGKGTGLGLSTVYGIVRQNGGFIEVRSRLDAGTTFDIHFPRTEEDAVPLGAAENPEAPPRGVERILVVEDDDTIRRLVKRLLERQGYSVVEARDGVDAHRRMEETGQRIDLLLSDVVMPHMDGRQLLLGLREVRPGLPALFMSGHAEDIVAHRTILDDRTGFLEKPFATNDLLRRIRDLLDHE